MTKCLMDIQEIQKYLPHRPPFLLVDRVLEMEPGKSIVALKNVTIDEPFFVGHFPQKHVMPGVLIIEAIAQASAVLALKSTEQTLENSSSLYVLTGIDNARFKRVVVPGDQLLLEVEIIKSRKSYMKIRGTASVDGEIACTAEIMSMKVE